MAKAKKSEDVPQGMREKFDRITAITDAFAQEHLDEEYAQLIRQATAALARKRPSPLASGTDKTWACGVTHALGMVNFLFDPAQTPHVSSKDLYKGFGVSASAALAKSKLVRDVLGMHQMAPDWCVSSLLDHNPLVWMITVNGMIMDARSAPREVQEIALAKGLIPYIPGEEPEEVPLSGKEAIAQPGGLYVLEVGIIDGPMTEKFIKKNRVVSRKIAIKGSQTLADLHHILFEAFDREEEHMYEFQIGGKGPHDPNARRYGLRSMMAIGTFEEDDEVQDVAKTSIASLGLKMGDAFGYWFDFGDDWWHQVNVVAIESEVPSGKYPRITERVGVSPPQYADF